MMRSNRMLSTLLGLAASMGFGGGGRPDPEDDFPGAPNMLPSRVRKGPVSINGKPKQKKRGTVRAWERKQERQARRHARRMNRR